MGIGDQNLARIPTQIARRDARHAVSANGDFGLSVRRRLRRLTQSRRMPRRTPLKQSPLLLGRRAKGAGIGCDGVGAQGLRSKPRKAGLRSRTDYNYDTSFKPITPATIKPMQASRDHEALSPNSAIPAMVTPSAPMPVQMA